GGFLDLLAGITDAVKEAGGEPFFVPAMGSHGGATAEGQEEILRLLGVTDESAGAPVRATMETFILGPVKNGAVAHLDRCAAEADGIIVFGRTRTHPESAEKLASGLLKMVTVGLGKQAGAQQAHNHGLWDSVKRVPELTMAKSKILFGVAVVENGYRQPLVVEVVPGNYKAFLASDQRLLEVAKPHVAKLPFDNLDLLIVDEVGKTVSGTGMDLNVIGRYRATGKGPYKPEITAAGARFGSRSRGSGVLLGAAQRRGARLPHQGHRPSGRDVGVGSAAGGSAERREHHDRRGAARGAVRRRGESAVGWSGFQPAMPAWPAKSPLHLAPGSRRGRCRRPGPRAPRPPAPATTT
ncbi:MAG: DUF362 domain-containing protein, partial [Acidobacteriia bacterium]|nr:DUF362 domain-containing protein [Terriglobia bacterium]